MEQDKAEQGGPNIWPATLLHMQRHSLLAPGYQATDEASEGQPDFLLDEYESGCHD
jgi:hypothetical protein